MSYGNNGGNASKTLHGGRGMLRILQQEYVRGELANEVLRLTIREPFSELTNLKRSHLSEISTCNT